MRVQAIATGFHGFLRLPGDRFEVPEGETASWFEPLAVPQDKGAPEGETAKAGRPAKAGRGESPLV